MTVCECGHAESDHRNNGACMAIVYGVPDDRICECNDYRVRGEEQ